MTCATELLHPANFCPVCGARLAPPATDGSAATVDDVPAGALPPAAGPAPPTLTEVPDPDKVVYLPHREGVEPRRSTDPVPTNPRAHEYNHNPRGLESVPDMPPRDLPPPSTIPLHPTAPPAPPALVEGITPPRAADAPDAPYGDFFADTPGDWFHADDVDADSDEPWGDGGRVLGTALASASILTLVAAWIVWAAALRSGAGGAEAGGFVLIAMILWGLYLALPVERQHRALVRGWRSLSGLIDRRMLPLRARTAVSLSRRRERERLRSMRTERSRRIATLGEASYRAFRQGELPAQAHPEARRVLAIERQMLAQEHRVTAAADTQEQEADPGGTPGHG